MKKKLVFAALLLGLMTGLVACGSGGSSEGILYSKYVSNNEGYYDHGELWRKDNNGNTRIDDVLFECMTKIDDNTIIGVTHEGPGTTRYIASYDLNEKTLTKITTIENTIDTQRVSVNEDFSSVYYADAEEGIVRYELSSGKKKGIKVAEDLKKPTVMRDGRTLIYLSDGKLHMSDLKNRAGSAILRDVADYALSNDESFIIYTKYRRDTNYSKITVCRYDIETGEDTELVTLNNKNGLGRLSISSNDTKFSYVTYTTAYFSSWAKTVVHVCDIDTLKSEVVYKSRSGESIDSVILF